MTEPTKQPTPAVVKAAPKAAIKTIKAVYGFMVDPHTAEEFTVIPKIMLPPSPWVQSQIDAGKLAVE